MPLPGRDHTFALEDCRALLSKLEREIERYKEIDTERVAAVADLTDLAFNISVTAWHLCDWVFADMTDEQRKKLSIYGSSGALASRHRIGPRFSRAPMTVPRRIRPEAQSCGSMLNAAAVSGSRPSSATSRSDGERRSPGLDHLRHRHAVDWLKSGRDIDTLQGRLGHTSVKTTEMYLDYLTPDEVQVAKFGRAVAQRVTHAASRSTATRSS
jgi:Phage integrase family